MPCTGLKKHASSPPQIVAAYLKRVELLREILQRDYQAARKSLDCMLAANEEPAAIERKYKDVQRLQNGCRSVWLYVDPKGDVNWPDSRCWTRYPKGDGSNKVVSYLDQVLDRLNAKRAQEGKAAIPSVTQSDFRDIYARWVYIQSGGNRHLIPGLGVIVSLEQKV